MTYKLQVVAVEDNPMDAEICAWHLAKAGLDCVVHRVDSETDFTSVLYTIKPDLIISDFTLPQFDGLRALEIAVARAPQIPFIFVSGTIGEERAIDALQRGATDYVLKSNLSRLSSAAERALRDAQLKSAQRQSDQQRRDHAARLERIAGSLALEVSTLRLHLAIQRIGVFEYSTTSQDVWWSEMMFDMFGEDSAAFRPTLKKWLAHILPEDRDLFTKNMGNVTSPSVRFRYRILPPGGAIRHLQSTGSFLEDDAGEATRFIGIVFDITERVGARQREQLLESSRHLNSIKSWATEPTRTLLNNVSDVLDSLATANTTACRALNGLRLDRLQEVASAIRNRVSLTTSASEGEFGKNLPNFLLVFYAEQAIHAKAVQAELDTIDRLVCHLRDNLAGTQELVPVRRQQSQGSQETVPLTLLNRVSDSSSDAVDAFALSAATEESHTEEEIAQQALEDTIRLKTVRPEQEQVQRSLAHQLEMANRLVTGIAHEINTTIRYISDCVHFLERAFDEMLSVHAHAGRPDDSHTSLDLRCLREEVPRALNGIVDGVHRVATIVRAMQESASSEMTERAPTDLNAALETTVLIARSECKDVATVRLLCGELPMIICNIRALRQVFLSLIANAARALAETGKGSDTGKITIRSALVDGCAEFQFEDNGRIIAPEVVENIFDPLVTTEELGSDSAQGLALAHSIVVGKHAGWISVASTPGLGTRVTLRLPLMHPI
jgi:signal transduction histidine kinase/DNA-binding response OmpR family regulator